MYVCVQLCIYLSSPLLKGMGEGTAKYNLLSKKGWKAVICRLDLYFSIKKSWKAVTCRLDLHFSMRKGCQAVTC